MSTVARRVAKLEGVLRPHECRRCRGKWIGVEFHITTPGDYEVGPNGEAPPMPYSCPACGRRMPKHYLFPDRAFWDGMGRP